MTAKEEDLEKDKNGTNEEEDLTEKEINEQDEVAKNRFVTKLNTCRKHGLFF